MQKDYFILDIKGGNHSLHGEIAFIKVNTVQEIRGTDGRLFSRSAIDYYCQDTETFIILADPNIINPIIFEAQSNNGVWSAEMSDFREETTFDETNGKRIKVHMFKGHRKRLLGTRAKRLEFSKFEEKYEKYQPIKKESPLFDGTTWRCRDLESE